MRNNILTLLVGFVVLVASVMLVKLGLDRMTSAEAAPNDEFAQLSVDLKRREILYRVQPGDTLWGLADRFYGNGRRWNEIARANDIREGQGLVSGAMIKIPLAGTAETIPEPIVAKSGEPALASYDEPLRPSQPRFGIDDAAMGVTLCQADPVAFPAGALCVARMGEDLCVTLVVFHAGDTTGEPVASYAAPKGDILRGIFAKDIDQDGTQELFTVWQRGDQSGTSRVFRIDGGEVSLICETPDDPVAVWREREARGK